MPSDVRVGASRVAASVALLAVGVPAAGAAPKPITGKLSKPGYTVIALAAVDRPGDRPANPRRMVMFTVNLTRCHGGQPWAPANGVSIRSTDRTGYASQRVYFKPL